MNAKANDATMAAPAGMVEVSAQGFTLAIADMPGATVAYLLANGYSQSLTDARTTAQARAIEAFAKETKASKAEVDAWKATEAGKVAIEAAGRDAMAKRQKALVDGTMVYGQRGPNGPRKSPLEAFMHETAEAELKARFRSKGWAWDKEKAPALIGAYIEKNRKSLETRFAKMKGADDDMADLLAAAGVEV